MYNGGATRTDHTTYTYDALDRVSQEVEDHNGATTTNDRTTAFTYQGVTALVTEEKQTGAGANLKTKTFSYDSYGHRIAMSDRPAGTQPGDANERYFTYGNDVHGSVSQLIDTGGNVKASYGYTAYGGVDSTDAESLTTGDTTGQAPINPYRYGARRMDSGTVPTNTPAGPAGAGAYDMGARRYGPDIAGFLQQDQFAAAIGDLGLALDPLTQNRYALAGGNPISFVETDGHAFIPDGGGGGSYTPQCSGDYCVGPPTNPTSFGPEDDGFKYDPNEKPTFEDYKNRQVWQNKLHGCELLGRLRVNERCEKLDDGLATYSHYWYGEGKDMTVDFHEGYEEDPSIRRDIDEEIARAQQSAEGISERYGLNSFDMTGTAHDSSYPETEDWQKALGGYQVWGNASVTRSGDKMSMKITVRSEDRYNFDPGKADIATGTPDAVNGRFATLGWAQGFNTHGQINLEVNWVVGQAGSATITQPEAGR